MRRETANIVLVLLGGALLKIAWSGDYLRFVKPSLLPFLVATGLVVVGLAGTAIVRDVRRGSSGEHEHGRSPWLLLLPVLAVFLVAPPALGADSVTRAAQSLAVQDRSGDELAALPPGGVVALPLGEFVIRAVWDAAAGVDGRTVRLTGFVVQGDEPRLARLRIACCAADAVPVTVRLRGADLSDVRSDTWRWSARSCPAPRPRPRGSCRRWPSSRRARSPPPRSPTSTDAAASERSWFP